MHPLDPCCHSRTPPTEKLKIMKQQTSIHVQPVKGGSEQHNKKEKELDYIRPELSHLNEYWEKDTQTDRLENVKSRYLKSTGQKMQAKATPIREAVVVTKRAFGTLSEKFIIYEDDDIWQKTPIITNPKIKKNEGVSKFYVFDEIWKSLLDFTKGYRKYELVTAMQFKSVYSMRMYELMSGQKRPLEFTFEQLREMLCIKDKYSNANDFKRWVLDIAKKELDENSPYSFNYIEIKEGRKVVGFKFFPTFHPDKQDPNLFQIEMRSKLTASAQISREA